LPVSVKSQSDKLTHGLRARCQPGTELIVINRLQFIVRQHDLQAVVSTDFAHEPLLEFLAPAMQGRSRDAPGQYVQFGLGHVAASQRGV
jgi:hypothetical protein